MFIECEIYVSFHAPVPAVDEIVSGTLEPVWCPTIDSATILEHKLYYL